MQNKKILKGSIIIIILTILGKAMAFIREALIASKFGATYITDVYMFSIGIIMLLTTIGYGLTTTFIPMHAENIENKSMEERNLFINKLLNTFGLITIIFIFICIAISPKIISIFGSGFTKNPEVFKMSVYILRIMFVSLFFVALQSIVTGVLQAHKEFSEPAAMAFVSNIIFVIYLIFLSNMYGITGFAIATVIGFAAQLFINVPKFKKLGYKYAFIIDFKDKDLLKLAKLMLPVIMSTSIIQINLFITRAFATNLSEGAVSILDFSNKLNMLIYEVFGVAIAMVVYPTLATYATQKNSKEYKNALIKAFNVILLIMIPASIGVLILREPIVSVIFERGQFGREAVKTTATALMFYSPAMIAYGVRDILYKAFYSIKDTKIPMINSLVAIILNIVISFILVKNMKITGLALASASSAVITTIILIFILNKRLKGINLKSLFKTFLKIAISSIVMGIVVIGIRNVVFNNIGIGLNGNLIAIILSILLGGLVYFILIHLFKIQEWMYIVEEVKIKIGKNKR